MKICQNHSLNVFVVKFIEKNCSFHGFEGGKDLAILMAKFFNQPANVCCRIRNWLEVFSTQRSLKCFDQHVESAESCP